MTSKQRAGQKGGRSRSAAKIAAVRLNGVKGGRPRKDVTPRPAPPGLGLPPLWQRIEAFLRANGPVTLKTLRCVAVTLAERERVREELKRRPALFHGTPSPTFGEDVWEINLSVR